MFVSKKIGIFNYFVVCILAFHHVQSDEPEEAVSTNRIMSRNRIVGGPFARRGEIKYVVVTRHSNLYYSCGGAILDDYHVLSAAHCFINEQNEFDDFNITVVAGIIDYNKENDPNRVEVDVERVYVHKDYSPAKLINDIAVMKLRNSLDIEKNNLTKVSLPSKSLNLTGKMAIMAGFGDDEHREFINEKNLWDEEGSSSGRLRKAEVSMLSNSDCQERYRRKKDKIYETYLCGKMVKEDEREEYGICNGDSGSSLVYTFKNKPVSVGIVSWSYGCDEREDPMVYTRVQEYLTFIKLAKRDKPENATVYIL